MYRVCYFVVVKGDTSCDFYKWDESHKKPEVGDTYRVGGYDLKVEAVTPLTENRVFVTLADVDATKLDCDSVSDAKMLFRSYGWKIYGRVTV